mgnify:CR=1 FL=1
MEISKKCFIKVGNCGEKYVILEIISGIMGFSGTITAKMDVKGRVFFPSAYRKQMGSAASEFVLRRDVYQPCLVIYPLEAWNEEVDALRRTLNRWNPQDAMVFRQFLAGAETLSLDAAGRFLVPRSLQKVLGDARELTFIGVDDRIEIWAAGRTEQVFLTDEALGAALQNLSPGVTG